VGVRLGQGGGEAAEPDDIWMGGSTRDLRWWVGSGACGVYVYAIPLFKWQQQAHGPGLVREEGDGVRQARVGALPHGLLRQERHAPRHAPQHLVIGG